MSMIALVTVPYDTREVVLKLGRDHWEDLRERVITMRLPPWAEGNPQPEWYWYGDTIPIVIPDDQIILDKYRIRYTVEKIKNSYAIEHKDPVSGLTYNLNFALPNIGLLSIREVTWRDDCCTEELQNLLNDGWRIIAVCPPNGARRPDYILGRMRD